MESFAEIPGRFAGLPVRHLFGVGFPVAVTLPARLLGLAFLDLAGVGPGLLIPRCRSVHTFGMRFPIDVHFLDRERKCISVHRSVGPGRVVANRRAAWTLETVPDLIAAAVRDGDARGGREWAGRD